MRRPPHHGKNRPTRAPYRIVWINEENQIADSEPSSTRLSRAKRHLERVRNSRPGYKATLGARSRGW